jgi:hypothetical protein
LTQRLTDYAIVLGVVLVLMSLFRLSRFLLHRFIEKKRTSPAGFSADVALLWGMRFLLVGLLMLPFITSLLAFIDNARLVGGMTLHLALTAVSVVLFSFAEDLFRDYNSYGESELKPVSWHARRLAVPVIAFWAIGCVFISPLFYSGLTILVAAFYRICLHFRRPPGKSSGNA